MKTLRLLSGLLVSLGAMGTAQAQGAGAPYADFAELLQRFKQEDDLLSQNRNTNLLPAPLIYRDSIYGRDRILTLNYEIRLGRALTAIKPPRGIPSKSF